MGIRGSKGLRRALVAVAVACATGVGVGSAQGAASCTVGSTCTVASEADLIAAIQAVDGTGPGASSPTTISFSADITLTSALPIINGPVTISGNGHTLDGGGSYRGFLLYNSGDTNGSGTPIQAAISDLTISNAVATGGAGGQGGGGGAGLGGAIFVAAGVHLITDQVTLTGDGAVGGKGGGVVPASDYDAGGGGGGMGGNGGALNGGGGGLGLGANGGSNGGGGSQGIAATLSAGGTSASGAAGGSYGGGGGAGVAGSND